MVYLIRKSDYIELYRVVDFSENRGIVEQLFGLKTVSIFSGDRSNPKLDIFGIRERIDVVGIIRERVEYNKQRKGIYESRTDNNIVRSQDFQRHCLRQQMDDYLSHCFDLVSILS